MSSGSIGVTKVELVRLERSWVIRSPSCSTSRISRARSALSGQPLNISWSSFAARSEFPPACANRSKKARSFGTREKSRARNYHARPDHLRTPGRSARSIDEAALDRPMAQLVPVGQLELSQHRAHMRLDRLVGDAQAKRDLLVLVAAGDEPQHLALAKRQPVELRVHLRLGDLTLEGVEHES